MDLEDNMSYLKSFIITFLIVGGLALLCWACIAIKWFAIVVLIAIFFVLIWREIHQYVYG